MSPRISSTYADGRECLADFDRREFRHASCSPGRVSRIGFDSPKGRKMWEELMILECPRCGQVTVESRYLRDVRCKECGRLLLI